MSGCCVALAPGPGAVCGPASYCASPAPAFGCANLTLVGNDGRFLGKATSNQFDAQGVCNAFSPYGSPFAADSIHNQFGIYGSAFSLLSAYDQFSFTPPHLFCVATARVLNFVSKNSFLPNAIDPDLLCAVLAANGY